MNKKVKVVVTVILVILLGGVSFFLGSKLYNKEDKNEPKEEVKEEKQEEPEEEFYDNRPVDGMAEEGSTKNTPPEPEVEEEEDNGIDINKVISDYKLSSIESYINEDKAYFKKFAKAVIDNDKIGSKYKRIVLLQYKVLMSNKKYLNKDYFLNSVKQLTMDEVKKTSVDGALGTYADYITTINIWKGMEVDVVYHELMHFVDYRINMGSLYHVCENNGKYTLMSEYYEYDCNEVLMPQDRLIVEGGAETNSARYNDEVTLAHYDTLTPIYNLIAYLIGEDKMNDIFYSSESSPMLFIELNKYGITLKEYEDFMEGINFMAIEDNFVGKVKKSEASYYMDALNFVSNLYKKKNGHDWDKDKEFSTLMNHAVWGFYQAVDYLKDTDFTAAEKKIVEKQPNMDIFKKQVSSNYTTGYQAGHYLLKNGKHYLVVGFMDSKYKTHMFEFEYDLVNDKILSKNEVK